MNKFNFWIFDNHLDSLIIFFNEITQFDACTDLEKIKYELHQTDSTKQIYFNLITQDNIIINAAKDSDDREIILWLIEYSDKISDKISNLELYLSSIESKI